MLQARRGLSLGHEVWLLEELDEDNAGDEAADMGPYRHPAGDIRIHLRQRWQSSDQLDTEPPNQHQPSGHRNDAENDDENECEVMMINVKL